MVGRPLVEVAAADAHIGDLEQHVFLADGGAGDLTDLDGALFGGEIDDGGGGHGGDEGWMMEDDGKQMNDGRWRIKDEG